MTGETRTQIQELEFQLRDAQLDLSRQRDRYESSRVVRNVGLTALAYLGVRAIFGADIQENLINACNNVQPSIMQLIDFVVTGVGVYFGSLGQVMTTKHKYYDIKPVQTEISTLKDSIKRIKDSSGRDGVVK